MKLIGALFNSFVKWKNYNKMIGELKAMSDYELRDMGISRSDICRIAAKRSI